jgi:hypothetical protein
MYAIIKPSDANPSSFQVMIYDGYQCKKIIRNGFNRTEAENYAEYQGLEIKKNVTK